MHISTVSNICNLKLSQSVYYWYIYLSVCKEGVAIISGFSPDAFYFYLSTSTPSSNISLFLKTLQLFHGSNKGIMLIYSACFHIYETLSVDDILMTIDFLKMDVF